MNDIITDEFIQAARDYSYLLENQYPRKPILKLIGDRYLLNKTQRVLLSRGIFMSDEVLKRKEKKTGNIKGEKLYIDGYNVLFTITNYLLGRIVFISNDGFVRDAGEINEKLQTEKLFYQSIVYLMDYLGKLKPGEIHFILDKPVPASERLVNHIAGMINKYSFKGKAWVVENPDAELIKISHSIIATSDSEIIDDTTCKVIDIPYKLLHNRFTPVIPDLSKILS